MELELKLEWLEGLWWVHSKIQKLVGKVLGATTRFIWELFARRREVGFVNNLDCEKSSRKCCFESIFFELRFPVLIEVL